MQWCESVCLRCHLRQGVCLSFLLVKRPRSSSLTILLSRSSTTILSINHPHKLQQPFLVIVVVNIHDVPQKSAIIIPLSLAFLFFLFYLRQHRMQPPSLFLYQQHRLSNRTKSIINYFVPGRKSQWRQSHFAKRKRESRFFGKLFCFCSMQFVCLIPCSSR